MGSSFLARWYDPALVVDADDTADTITRVERERLLHLHFVAAAAGLIPRRLGTEAGATELALDKRRSRRITHVALQCFQAWGGRYPAGASKDVSMEAAQVTWETWWDEHRTWLTNRIKYIATWALKIDDVDEKWAKSAIVKLTNELTWLQYALRDD